MEHYLQGFEGWQWVSHSGDYTWWNIQQCMVCVIAWSSSSTLCGEFTRCIHSTRIFSLLPHLTAAWLAQLDVCHILPSKGSWIQPPLKHCDLVLFSPLKKRIVWREGCALAKPGCPWCLTFALGRLENHSFFGRNPMLVTLNFTGSDLRALFNFSKCTAL